MVVVVVVRPERQKMEGGVDLKTCGNERQHEEKVRRCGHCGGDNVRKNIAANAGGKRVER